MSPVSPIMDTDMYTSDIEIEHIALGVIRRTLPKPEWTHAAHFAAAAWLIRSADYDAESDMPGLIRRYNTAYGVPNTDSEGYHETITLASIHMAHLIMSRLADTMPVYEAVNLMLMQGFNRSDWILKHWSRPVLFSPEARRHWVAPDLLPLPQR